MQKSKNFTYVMVKPYSTNNDVNTLAQSLILKEIKTRLSQQGLNVLYESKIQYTPETVKRHYRDHVGKSFYPGLEAFLLKNKAIGLVVADSNYSQEVISNVRAMAGSTIKIDSQTGNIRLPEAGSIRYNMFFKLYQMLHGVKEKDVVIPENVDNCQKVYNQETNCVDIFQNGKQICSMSVTENLVHTSSSVEDATNELLTFYKLCNFKTQTKNNNEQQF